MISLAMVLASSWQNKHAKERMQMTIARSSLIHNLLIGTDIPLAALTISTSLIALNSLQYDDFVSSLLNEAVLANDFKLDSNLVMPLLCNRKLLISESTINKSIKKTMALN
jgi:hypothetical protein